MNKGYYIPAIGTQQIAGNGEFCECPKCHRKILVTMGLIGTTHHIGLEATCADCLEISDNFRTARPDIVERIENWMSGKEIGPQYLLKTAEEVHGSPLALEHTPRPGTITGAVIVNEKIIQTFMVLGDGKLTLDDAPNLTPDNYVLSGSYKDFYFELLWKDQENIPQFILKVNYEYEV